MYTLREIFHTLQGEGYHTGRPAVFARFAGCNLWTGREEDRADAVCKFCDTEFVGVGPDGGKFADAAVCADAIEAVWVAAAGPHAPHRMVVCTGGEPLLQVDEALVTALHARGFFVAVETNGTQPAPRGIDWITVSPKAGAPLALRYGNELKLVFPQEHAMPDAFAHLEFTHWFVQPMDGPQREAFTARAIDWCLRNPQWRLSLQTHKLLGLR
ncbi:MAG: 7-carboxy-7-deazaguanine synthase [Gemmatimonadetes bacterium]|nr:7-carboxy-7-deazaguanine synthase [Gemmatimonadota bacterium]